MTHSVGGARTRNSCQQRRNGQRYNICGPNECDEHEPSRPARRARRRFTSGTATLDPSVVSSCHCPALHWTSGSILIMSSLLNFLYFSHDMFQTSFMTDYFIKQDTCFEKFVQNQLRKGKSM